MKASMIVRRAALSLAAMAALGLASCAEGPAGIFSRVSSDTPINETMTEAIKYATPSFVARLGTTWYAGIGALWSKADGQTTWSPATVTGVSDAAVVAGSGAVVSGALYVAFAGTDTGDSLGVWKSTNGTSWSEVTTSFSSSGEQLRRVLAANDQLFAVTATVASDLSETYALYRFDGTAFQPAGISDNGDIGAPDSVAYFGGAYWFSAGSWLVTGTAGALSAVAGPATAAAFGGVCSTGTGLIVASDDGYLYYSTDGATWARTTTQLENASSKVFSLSAPTYIDDGTRKILVVGTNREPRSSSDTPPVDGYLDFDLAGGFAASAAPTDDHALVSSATNFDASLSAKSVRSMPLFDAGDGTFKLFALTDGNGLWSDTFDGDSWGGWIRE